MSDKLIKITNAFYAAKRVDHYYWMHTDGDDGMVSVENIQKIIELLTETNIEKFEVDHHSEFHRAFVERSDDGKTCKIYVMKSEDDSWKRFAAVKEMCHILIDSEDDFQPNPCITIHALKDGPSMFDDQSAPETDSEGLAEIIAMELIYPLEYRRADSERLKNGDTLAQISQERLIPTKYISLGTTPDRISACEMIWKTLKPVDPKNLDHLL